MAEALQARLANEREAICKLPEVKGATGLSKSTIYRKMADGSFPKQCRIGKRAVGWKKSSISNWLTSLKEVE